MEPYQWLLLSEAVLNKDWDSAWDLATPGHDSNLLTESERYILNEAINASSLCAALLSWKRVWGTSSAQTPWKRILKLSGFKSKVAAQYSKTYWRKHYEAIDNEIGRGLSQVYKSVKNVRTIPNTKGSA